MLSIDGALDLLYWAYEHGNPGDLFVQKASAATIGTLAHAAKQVFQSDSPIQIIGTRHGEKLHETLLTREEMAVAEDMGGYYRVAADGRDRNYALYVDEGRRVPVTAKYPRRRRSIVHTADQSSPRSRRWSRMPAAAVSRPSSIGCQASSANGVRPTGIRRHVCTVPRDLTLSLSEATTRPATSAPGDASSFVTRREFLAQRGL